MSSNRPAEDPADEAGRATQGARGPATVGVLPGIPLEGLARVPGSKSIAQRALLAAALAKGTTQFAGLPPGEDVIAAAGMASRLASLEGPGVDRGTDEDARSPSKPIELYAAESGTLARLTLAVAGLGAAGPGPFTLSVAGSLKARRTEPLLEALRSGGAQVELPAEGFWPLGVRPGAAVPERVWLVDAVSSQEASGLCLALAAFGGRRTVELAGRLPSQPYLRLTLGVLSQFGVTSEVHGLEGERGHITVDGPLVAPAAPFVVETDASLAAVALAAGVASGGRIEVDGVPAHSLQGDARIHQLLAGLGFESGRDGERLFAAPRVTPHEGSSVLFDLEDVPDLAPILIALTAAVRPGRATFTGLETLNRKESSRLDELAKGLALLEVPVETGDGSLTLERPPELTGGDPIEFDCAGDHRMAFAWSLVGLSRTGVTLRGTECVAKSWPGYFDELERLGARLRR